MKAWKKTYPELVAAFDNAVSASPSVARRPMFGHTSAFVNGKMFAGTFQDAIVVQEYVVPAPIVAKPKGLGTWIERGHRSALTLPAKGATTKSTTKKTATRR